MKSLVTFRWIFRNILFVFHNNLKACASNIKIIAVMITPASVAFGINWNVTVKKLSAKITNVPVNTPPKGVCTPDALFIAVRVNDPVVGIDRKNDPQIFDIPNAIISWVASTLFPFARMKKKHYPLINDPNKGM